MSEISAEEVREAVHDALDDLIKGGHSIDGRVDADLAVELLEKHAVFYDTEIDGMPISACDLEPIISEYRNRKSSKLI